MLQISHTEPAVRHAVLAVSSLHEGLVVGFSEGSLSHSPQSFALHQYNKAIARLLDQMNNPLTKPLASLLTCVLFVCIEYLQGKEKESLIHLEQGRQLLTRLNQRSNDPDMEYIVRHVVPLYTRLSLTSFLFGGSPVPIPDALKPQRDIPVTFESLDSMRHTMHEFMEQAFRFTQNARPAKNPNDSIPHETMTLLEVEQDRLLSRLAKLNVAFSLFRAARSNPSPESALLVLQMYLHAQHIWVSTALSSSEVVYDDFLPSFAAIVPLAAAYLDLDSSSQNRLQFATQSSRYLAVPEQLSVAYTSNFSFETHIIPPLYYVATKCRHPLIRRSALDLLRRNPSRRENLWRASVMGALAGHIVSLEEQWSQKQASSAIRDSTISTDYASNHNEHLEQMTPSHAKSQGGGIYSTGPGTDATLSMARLSAVSGSMTTPSFERPTESPLPMNTEAPLPLSHLSLLTASVDDDYSSSSWMEPTSAFLSLPGSSNTWNLQQQQQETQQHLQNEIYQVAQTSYNEMAPYETIQAQSQQYRGDCSIGYSSHSGGSSEISSVDLDEQQSYQSMLRGQSPPHEYQSQQFQHQDTHLSGAPTWAPPPPPPPQQQQRHLPANLITEAPFGLPEELRVHDAIIGPEREDGTWVAVFRKLHGVDEDWDVQNDWVATT